MFILSHLISFRTVILLVLWFFFSHRFSNNEPNVNMRHLRQLQYLVRLFTNSQTKQRAHKLIFFPFHFVSSLAKCNLAERIPFVIVLKCAFFTSRRSQFSFNSGIYSMLTQFFIVALTLAKEHNRKYSSWQIDFERKSQPQNSNRHWRSQQSNRKA